VFLADELPPLYVKKIRGLNLPGTPWATSACRGRPLLYFYSSSLLGALALSQEAPVTFVEAYSIIRIGAFGSPSDLSSGNGDNSSSAVISPVFRVYWLLDKYCLTTA